MPGISQVITTKNWEKWHFCDAPLNFTFSIWNLNLVLGPHVQTNWKPATKSRYDRFCIFSDRYFGHISRTKNKTQKKRPAFSWLVGAWSTSCPKITPKYVILSGAWPIRLSGSDLAGPARRCSLKDVHQELGIDYVSEVLNISKKIEHLGWAARTAGFRFFSLVYKMTGPYVFRRRF